MKGPRISQAGMQQCGQKPQLKCWMGPEQAIDISLDHSGGAVSSAILRKKLQQSSAGCHGLLCMRTYTILLFPSLLSSPRWSLVVASPDVCIVLLAFDPILPNTALRKNFWPVLTHPLSAQSVSTQTMPWACLGPSPSPECSSPAAVVPSCPRQSPQLVVFLCMFASFVPL